MYSFGFYYEPDNVLLVKNIVSKEASTLWNNTIYLFSQMEFLSDFKYYFI